jgi:putative FmdB family regulatory protein
MPIYDYRCQDCGEISEILRHEVSNAQSITCPLCGSERMERLLSASYLLQTETRAPGKTCCGREERCQAPPCSTGEKCRRH